MSTNKHRRIQILLVLAATLAAAPASAQKADLRAERVRPVPFGLSLAPGVTTDFNIPGPVTHRFSLGLAGASAAGLDGFALAGALDVRTSWVHGLQLAGAVSIGGEVHGVQVSGAVSIGGEVRGAQVSGALNVAGELHGFQLGTVNVAGRGHGVQLGVVNVSSDPDGVPIGLINVVKGGPVRFDGWAESSGITAVGLRHGSRRFHTVYALGLTPFAEESGAFAGIGLGGHVDLGEVAADLDAMSWFIPGADKFFDSSTLFQLRLTVVLERRPVAGFIGVAANVFRDEHGQDGERFSPSLDYTDTDGDTTVRVWPSVLAGVRFE